MLTNSIKIQTLLSRGNSILRNIFSIRWRKYSGSEWEPSSAKTFTFGIGKKVYDKLQRIQRNSVESGHLNEWDLSTLTDVLMLTDFPTEIISKQAKSAERSNLEELKKVRNKLAHAPTLGVEDELFEILWRNASEVLIFFGCSNKDLDKIKFSSNLSAFQDENSSGRVDKANSEEATRLKKDANDFYKSGQFEKAIEIYSKAIPLRGLLDSELAILYSNRSVAYLASAEKNNKDVNSEETHCALQDGKEAIRLNPTWYRGYLRTANSYFKLGKFGEALEYFDNALSLSPSSEELLQARDNCRMRIGKEARREHMDPSTVLKSEADQIKEFETRSGIPVTKTQLAKAKKQMRGMIPGFAYLEQAQDIMLGTRKDPELAAKLYAKAAALGSANGMYNLGLLYKEGVGIKQDLKMYIKLLEQAASQPHKFPGTTIPNSGVAEAEHSLGLAYEEGVGVTRDVSKAMEWYQKSSDHGCMNASNNLGYMYMNGHGIPMNIERGVQYWKLSSNQGNSLSMQALAIHYLKGEKDPRQAKEWYDRAVKHGNLDAQLNMADFEEKLKKLEKEIQKNHEEVVEWEKKSGLSGKGMTFKCRMKRMIGALEPGLMEVMDGLVPIENRSSGRSAPRLYDPTILQKYAQNGSKTACKILTAMSHFDTVCGFLMGTDLQKSHAQILHELSECYRLEGIVAQLLPDWRERLRHLVTEALQQSIGDTKNDLDKDARVCFVHLEMDTFDHNLIFAQHSKKKYPNERAFHQHVSYMCGFLGKYELGVKETDKSLKMFPKDVDLLYCRAGHLRLLETEQRDDVIKAYEEYLSVAPPDERKVPEAYYAISNEYFAKCGMKTGGKKNGTPSLLDQKRDMELMNKMEEYHQLGLDAEKLQLPCFLPYQSNQKTHNENCRVLIPLIKSKFSKIKNKSGQSSKVLTQVTSEVKPKPAGQVQEAGPNYVALSDPNRILIIKSHREHLLDRRSLQGGKKILLKSHTTTPANSQRAPVKLTGLKPITFLQMDTQVDKVYEGRVIQVTSVEDAAFGGPFPSIQLVLEDECGNIFRGSIYNFPETDEKTVQQKLGFGAKMSILNPYMRLARDGSFGLRVDDPASLFLHTSATKLCRFCMKEKADLHCGNCKWANYCSRKCQEMDWKLMKHKLICVPL